MQICNRGIFSKQQGNLSLDSIPVRHLFASWSIGVCVCERLPIVFVCICWSFLIMMPCKNLQCTIRPLPMPPSILHLDLHLLLASFLTPPTPILPPPPPPFLLLPPRHPRLLFLLPRLVVVSQCILPLQV